ncbi:hypothetical protein FRC10_007972 [Ceratobasidium sp. 414]|nr:hypothetical protein FRC10_007972 [Ceratobasidium sp. 414]
MSTHSKNNTIGTKVYTLSSHPMRMDEVIRAVSVTPKMIIICGAGVSVWSGMPRSKEPVRLSHDKYSEQTTLHAAIQDCSPSNPVAKDIPEGKLVAFNKLMTEFRIRARMAPSSPFHQFVQRALSEQRISFCLTKNFDGLETRGMNCADSRVIMVHGDNSWLRCCTPLCPGIDPQRAAELDSRLLSGNTVACPRCTAKGEHQQFHLPFFHSTFRCTVIEGALLPVVSKSPDSPPLSFALSFLVLLGAVLRFFYFLLAESPFRGTSDEPLKPTSRGDAVQATCGSPFCAFSASRRADRNGTHIATDSCDLLLLIGVSLKCEDTFELVDEIAEKVHRRYGGVVYIDQQPIRGRRNTNHCIDFHLQIDIQEFSELVMNAMDTKPLVDEDAEMESEGDGDTSDLWYEVSERRVLPPSPKE